MKLTPADGCVVVSGAGSGLGRAMALDFSKRGFEVHGLGRRMAALEETTALCDGAFVPHALDVADIEAVRLAIDTIETQTPIAVLVNNAAVYPREDFLAGSPESFHQTVDVNLGGMVNLCHATLPHMAERGVGRVLNVATFADLNPLAGAAAYSVSKGAARIFTRALIADMADRFPNIVVNDWMPGMLQTTMGIPDGLPPELAASWGVAHALDADPALMGTTFQQNMEVLPPVGLKGKVKALLTGKRRKPRVIHV